MGAEIKPGLDTNILFSAIVMSLLTISVFLTPVISFQICKQDLPLNGCPSFTGHRVSAIHKLFVLAIFLWTFSILFFTSTQNSVWSNHQYADRPSMRKFDKQTPFMEKIEKKKNF